MKSTKRITETVVAGTGNDQLTITLSTTAEELEAVRVDLPSGASFQTSPEVWLRVATQVKATDAYRYNTDVCVDHGSFKSTRDLDWRCPVCVAEQQHEAKLRAEDAEQDRLADKADLEWNREVES